MFSPLHIVILSALFSAIIFVVILNKYENYRIEKVRQELRRKHIADMILCLCGHSKWLHFNKGCADLVWNTSCRCRGYVMDNLAYLEQVIE